MNKYSLLNRLGLFSTLLFVGAISQIYLKWMILVYGILMFLSLLLVLIIDGLNKQEAKE